MAKKNRKNEDSGFNEVEENEKVSKYGGLEDEEELAGEELEEDDSEEESGLGDEDEF